jgi:hypothetical protein
MECLNVHRFIRPTRNLRKKLDYKFSQQNMNYMSEKLYRWIHIQMMFPMVYLYIFFLIFDTYVLVKCIN